MTDLTDTSSTPIPADNPSRGGKLLALLAVVAVAVLAWRATTGVSAMDDSYYVAMGLRLAQGARPMADEWTLQVLGFLVTVPLVKAWTALFGLTGLALVLRLYFVALATGAWYAAFRALRPTFGSWASALAPAVPLLAVPFGILMLSYNTGAMIGFVLAVCFGFAALRDSSTGWAIAAGVAIAVAGASYPSLAFAAAAYLIAFTILARREWRLLACVWGGAAVIGVFAVGVLALSATPHQIKVAIDYTRATWADVIPPEARLPAAWGRTVAAAASLAALPLWAFAVVSAIPWRDRRISGIAAGVLPLAAGIPTLVAISTGVFKTFGRTGSGYLIYFTLAALIPVVVRAVRLRDAEIGRLLAFSAPIAVVGVPLVTYSTSAGFYWGLFVVGFAALSTAVVLGWLRVLAEDLTPGLVGAAGAVLAACLVAILLSFTFMDGPPLELSYRIPSGTLAGLATTPANGAQISALEKTGARLMVSRDGVLFLGGPIGYLLVGGKMETNAVWLNQGRADASTVGYLQKKGLKPEYVFVTTGVIEHDGGLLKSYDEDPMMRWLSKRYTVAGSVPGYIYFRRR